MSRLASFSPLLRFSHVQNGSGTGEKIVASKDVYDVKRKQTFQFSWVVDYYYSAKEALCTNVPP